MHTTSKIALLLALSLSLVAGTSAKPPVSSYSGSQCADPALTPQQRAGCEIWFYATAGNGRFHTYVLPQRLPVLLNWYRVLNSTERADRFKAWGIINDPDCCTPGAPNCPKRKLEETYGMDYCQGDEELLKYVGREGYRDPACDASTFHDSPVDPSDRHKGQRQSSCDLAFGTSSGGMGIRKFPNPRFNAEAWKKLNGSLDSWKGFTAEVKPETFHSRLRDASVEPPFYFGMSCGACHIAFDPTNPPKDPANPKHENIKGAIGNQYSMVTAIMSSGEASSSPLFRIFNYIRAGTVDTSAFPHDFISNAGTPNAIINFDKRPTFPNEELVKWFQTDRCATGANEQTCWCEPGRDHKCWERRHKTSADGMDPHSPVMHILKGGEDSIGLLEAIQRVYINIGSCSETCWVNHLTNFFVVDPTQRGFGQTPFDIGQCRRDCPNFRAIEDRLPDIAAFLSSQRPAELYVARGLKSRSELAKQLDGEFGAGSVKLGRELFADNCARCHSSQKPDATGSFRNVDFVATDAKGVRTDFLSNDESTPVSEIGTNRARALHSNHMEGHVWAQYGSNTLRQRSKDPNIPDPSDGGRGYYRNISLLSAWAYAPFMHNNAIGPEICGNPADRKNDLYASPYVDEKDKPLKNAPPCWAYNASIPGRFKLYQASMDELLTTPERRSRKVALLSEDVVIEPGPKLWDPIHKQWRTFRVVIPAGVPQSMVQNLLYKDLIADMTLSVTDPSTLRKKVGRDEDVQELKGMLQEFATNLSAPMNVVQKHERLVKKFYMTNTDFVENEGHPFGTGLSDREKKALIAFVATL